MSSHKTICPHCNKEISIRIEADDELEKEVTRRTKGLRDELTRIKGELKKIKNQ